MSLFAGAVWRAGGIAFEEFSSDKERPGKKGEVAAGRIDLRFSYDRETYGVEAKICWPAVGQKAQSAEDAIRLAMDQARTDALCIPKMEGKKLAMVFASPSFPKSEFDDAKKRLKRWREIFGAVRCEGKAFVWIRDCELIEDEGYLYPGAAIFISEVAV
ncbi:MAG: hypothetical protein NTY19_04375 [Planctomycetota bacterium]|nr:hypothetical protein [Planctomycetota bacterium]